MGGRQPYMQKDFSGDEFRGRRKSLLEMTEGEGIVVLAGAAATGAFDMFRQTNDFYYLCGVEVPQSYLLLDGRDQASTLYLPPRDEKMERSEGAVLTADDLELVVKILRIGLLCYTECM